MKNLGTAGASITAAILIGNASTVPMLRPFTLKAAGLLLGVGMVALVFLYVSKRFNPLLGWIAAIGSLLVLFILLGAVA